MTYIVIKTSKVIKLIELSIIRFFNNKSNFFLVLFQ